MLFPKAFPEAMIVTVDDLAEVYSGFDTTVTHNYGRDMLRRNTTFINDVYVLGLISQTIIS